MDRSRGARPVPWLVIALLLSLPCRMTVGAQASSRTTVTNANMWLSYTGDHALGQGARTGLHLELQLRRADLGANWQQLLARGGVSRTLSPAVRITGGYAFIRTYPYGAAPVRAEIPEHRSWQQLSVAQTLGSVGLTHRYRLEQRWSGITGVDAAEPKRVTDWRYTNRARYLTRVTLPLGGASAATARPYITAWNELFINFGERVQLNVFDQNRSGVAIGRQLTGSLRAEVGYLHHYLLKSSGRDAERNHTVHIGVLSNAPLDWLGKSGLARLPRVVPGG